MMARKTVQSKQVRGNGRKLRNNTSLDWSRTKRFMIPLPAVATLYFSTQTVLDPKTALFMGLYFSLGRMQFGLEQKEGTMCRRAPLSTQKKRKPGAKRHKKTCFCLMLIFVFGYFLLVFGVRDGFRSTRLGELYISPGVSASGTLGASILRHLFKLRKKRKTT